jgi:3-hydroxyisobutyrate dehydrogenase-like beta-hydroxyacid dehydrogenase
VSLTSENQTIGFLGAGLMGKGMVMRLLDAGRDVRVVAHRNRAPIDALISHGAIEEPDPESLAAASDAVIFCLPNADIAAQVLDQILPSSRKGMLVIDCTTSHPDAVVGLEKTAAEKHVLYAEAPLTGGVAQAEAGRLGAILGASEEVARKARAVLEPCCSAIEHMGPVGMGATTKLISNFLSLGTATLVMQAMRAAGEHGVDWGKFYRLACQGSGHSMSLDRIAPAAIAGRHDGYVFSLENTIKDLGYIETLLRPNGDAGRLASLLLDIVKEGARSRDGQAYLSSLLNDMTAPPKKD